jgi:hypothetical protein
MKIRAAKGVTATALLVVEVANRDCNPSRTRSAPTVKVLVPRAKLCSLVYGD